MIFARRYPLNVTPEGFEPCWSDAVEASAVCSHGESEDCLVDRSPYGRIYHAGRLREPSLYTLFQR